MCVEEECDQKFLIHAASTYPQALTLLLKGLIIWVMIVWSVVRVSKLSPGETGIIAVPYFFSLLSIRWLITICQVSTKLREQK